MAYQHRLLESGNVCPLDDRASAPIAGVAVTPSDVAAEHAGLSLVGGVVGAVRGEGAQGGGLGLDAVQPGAVGRCGGELDVVGRSPVADPGVLLRGRVRGEMVEHDRDADLGRVETAQVAAAFQEPGPVLLGVAVAVPLVLGPVVGGEQVADPVRVGVGGASAGTGSAAGVLVSPAAFGPLPAWVGLEVERTECIRAEDDFGLTLLGDDRAVGDRLQVLDGRLLGRVVRVAGGLPGRYPLQ